MTNVVRFPSGRRVPATTIPREEFGRLAELALDVVDRIVAILDEDRDPSPANSEHHTETLASVDSVRYTDPKREDRV